MDTSIVNIGLAFLEGLGIILSPCILPVLPIILSGSVSEGKNRPLGIILGFILSFSAFSLVFRQIIKVFNIDSSLLYDISLVLLAILGATMLFSFLSNKFEHITQFVANIGQSISTKENSFTKKSGFNRGFWTGLLIGFIWTPCAGPILGAVLVQSAAQPTDILGTLTVISFCIGVAVPMFLIMLFGRNLISKLSFLQTRLVLIRKTFGALILISALYLSGLLPF